MTRSLWIPMTPLLLAAALGCGVASDPAEPHDSLYTCSTVSDCVLVRTACGGSMAVNVGHADEAEEQQRQIAAAAMCQTIVFASFHAECIDHWCTTIEEEAPPAEP